MQVVSLRRLDSVNPLRMVVAEWAALGGPAVTRLAVTMNKGTAFRHGTPLSDGDDVQAAETQGDTGLIHFAAYVSGVF